LKRKGKAAIFKELLNGKLRYNKAEEGDDEKPENNEKDTEEKEPEESETNEKVVQTNEESNGLSEGNRGNYQEPNDQELLDQDTPGKIEASPQTEPEEHDNGERKKISSQDDDSDSDIGPPRKHVKVLHMSSKPKSHDTTNDASVDDLDILHDIASTDHKVSMAQAEALMKIQKQEVTQDLLKLKEVTQDGLQNMFAKAVAKQQKFMDDVQGNVVARDQLSQDPQQNLNDKLLAYRYMTQQQPPQRNQPMEKDYLQSRDDLEDEDASRKSHVNILANRRLENHELTNQREENDDYDDDLVDPDSTQDGGSDNEIPGEEREFDEDENK